MKQKYFASTAVLKSFDAFVSDTGKKECQINFLIMTSKVLVNYNLDYVKGERDEH